MTPTPDIGDLLRQKQMMDQFNQITSQGTQAAMMQPGINQFDDTGGGSQGGQGAAYTGLPAPQPRRTAPAAPVATDDVAKKSTVSKILGAPQALSNAIGGGINRATDALGGLIHRGPQAQLPQNPVSLQMGTNGNLMVNPGGPSPVQTPPDLTFPSFPGYNPKGFMQQ